MSSDESEPNQVGQEADRDEDESQDRQQAENAESNLPEEEMKKMKNRHSTQLSRKRRKLYEDLLEEKYNDLNNQYKQEIQKLNLNNSLSDKMKKYISFLRQKKVIESKMEESMARDALDKEVIGKILMDGVLYRLGPKGHTRESLCNLLINMIIDEIFPEPYKFVFCLLNQDGSGGWNANSEWDKLNSLLHEDQVKLMRERFGPEVLAIKSRYNKTITRLTNLKNNILEDQKEVESLLHQAANVISSTKRSNYVNFIEFSILGNEKLDTFLEENEVGLRHEPGLRCLEEKETDDRTDKPRPQRKRT